MDQKFFPIKTDTACQLKWNWSTLYLHNAHTASCHRTSFSDIDPSRFSEFHNTPTKIQDRQDMLAGLWPEKNCAYCREIEQSGGFSDRMLHLEIPDLSPPELATDPNAVVVSPTILEVYFNNTCNLACLYCIPDLSSKINQEYEKHGDFVKHGVRLQSVKKKSTYGELIERFWTWMDGNSHRLKRLNVLGGEPFYQEDFYRLLDRFDIAAHPDLELNITTNLMVTHDRLRSLIDRWQSLLSRRHLKRIDLTCSIDCWGGEQEYVRYGIDLEQWQKNFQTLLDKKWIKLNINQTITVLTIKTMPQLLERLSTWREARDVGHYFSAASPQPSYLMPHVLGGQIFQKDFETIISLMPDKNQQDSLARSYMRGIRDKIMNSHPDQQEKKNLRVFLEEKDRRRDTNWRQTFPWLVEEIEHVV